MRSLPAPRLLLLLLLLPIAVMLGGCSPDFEGMAERRLAYARQNKGDIEIVAIQDAAKSAYLNGVMLAAAEINQRQGKLLGRNLNIRIEQDGDTFEDIKPTIRRIVANPRTVAVLGHRRSKIALPASVIYERSQVVFMPSFATTQVLTNHNFQYVYRMAPNTEIMAEQLASAAKTLGYQKMVMLYSREDLNRELAFLFEDKAIKQGIRLVKRSSFFDKDTNYRPIISQFNSEKFDAIFITAASDAAGRMALQLREMGIRQPILGDDSMNRASYTDAAGDAADGTIIPSLYKADDSSALNQQFIRQYQKKYETDPDYNAAQGYDSLMLLAAAIERAGSTTPPLLSSALHYMPAWVGLTGIHAYDQAGELRGKKYFFQARQEGKWYALPALQIPYLLERFSKEQQEKYGAQRTVTDFRKIFTEPMHDDDNKIYLLDLAQEILQFKRIGIIYENTADGRKAAGYELLQGLAKRKQTEIVGCTVAFSALNKRETEQAMIDCYGRLSLKVDAMLIPPYYSIDAKLLQRLNQSLAFFKIPSISLDEHNTDPNICLVLGKRSDIDVQGKGGTQAYNGLLNGLKVHEFAERMKNLPEVSVNLVNLQRYGLSDTPILLLSPNAFIYPDETAIVENRRGAP
ncbi:ABC transporter substrate-binding protein [Candidatus Thiothrix sp. Deng01]|uniref:ABC transporter substrate-binding protein n=1 Tax=Candidatus Thiothrix phosphatis TaxID=3112415 RepID=A0ABU6CXK7_9GAMM|nr:ABC transporter substrate-binding protein [Candidatus Thiothrix sp. Deng01]MEB4591306.1 ABC transporter substrate-binding protein [Candidatus Thiothrix sp. Deng01]